MSKETLCYLVLGASLGVLLHRAVWVRKEDAAEALQPAGAGEVINLAAWKAARGRAVALNAG